MAVKKVVVLMNEKNMNLGMIVNESFMEYIVRERESEESWQ